MTAKISIVICLLIIIAIKASSQEFWIENNFNYSYRQNDFYIKDCSGYQIIQSQIRSGLSILKINTKGLLQFYISTIPIYDMLNNNWNKVDWHNNFVYGVGCQLRFNPTGFLFFHTRDFNIEMFAEKSWIYYFPKKFKNLFFIGHRPSNDVKIGIRYWFALTGQNTDNFNKKLYIWLDSADGFFYAKSSFYNVSHTGFYLINFNNKIGFGLDHTLFWPLEIYFVHYLELDVGQKIWNKLDWNNRSRFGGGIRLKYIRFPKYIAGRINIEVEPFLEYVFIRYNKRVPYIPSYRPKWDVQSGISLWFSFSQTKG